MIKKKKTGMDAFTKRLSAIREKQGKKVRLPKNHPPRPSGDGDHEYR